MSTWSKPLSILISLVLAVGLCPAPAFAGELDLSGGQPAGTGLELSTQSASHSRDEAVAWARSQIGKWLDYDKAYGAQCVDLTKYYYDYLGVGARTGNGYAYVNGNLPGGWTRSSSPQPGDVAAWAAGKGVAGSVGHVAIVVEVSGSRFTVVEQSGNTTACRYNTYATSNPSNFLRPDWPSSGPIEPRIWPEAGAYTIQSAVGNKVLDVAGGYSDEGTNVWIYQPIDNVGQVFNIGYNDTIGSHWIQMRSSGKFVSTINNANGHASSVLYSGDGSNGQNFYFIDAGGGYVYIRNLWGYYLDVSGGTDANCQDVQFYSFNGSSAQKWKLVRVCGNTRMNVDLGSYVIQSAVGSKVLDVEGGVEKHGTNVKIYHPIDNNGQVFQIGWNDALAANNIAMKSCGKWIGTLDNTNGQATSILQDGDGSNGQNWFFEDAGDGYVYIRNLWGYYLDVDNGTDEDSRNVQVFPFNGSIAQKWKLVRVSGNTRATVKHGSYNMKSMVGNKVLTLAGANTAEGTAVEIRTPSGDGSQVFDVAQPGDNPWLFIKLPSIERFIGAKGNANGMAACVVQPGDGSNGQNWFFEDAGDGSYYIRNLWG
ncbi:MAG: RICIN domain-containing protein, partial [Eggerthellaceae bacterium]|nr:RICIN domain-containing protein [Eggerthellaceae bacterium]